MPLSNRARSSIIARIIMADTIHVTLRYIGPDVDKGEMDIDEVVAALQGFSSAYGKVVAEVAPESRHQLKVTALRESSFDVIIAATIIISQAGDTFEIAKSIVNAAKYTFRLITEVVTLKKHTRSEQYVTRVDGTRGDVTVINAEKVEINVSLPAFEIYRSKKRGCTRGPLTPISPFAVGQGAPVDFV